MIQKLKKTLAPFWPSFPEVSLVYLFGSQAEGNIGPLSDIDLAVLLDRQADSAQGRERLKHEFTSLLGTPRLDVVWLLEAPVELAFAVISQGQVLYERDLATRVEYEAMVMSRYGDYLPILRAQRADILKGGNIAARVQWYREALGRTERTLGQIRAAQKQSQIGNAMEIRHYKFSRITLNPEKCFGKPCIRGLRMPVASILNYLSSGMTVEDILQEWPELEREDIYQALGYAAWTMEERVVPLEEASSG